MDLRGPTSKGGQRKCRVGDKGREREGGDGRPPDFELATDLVK